MVENKRLAIAAPYPLPGLPAILHDKVARVRGCIGEGRKSNGLSLLAPGIVAAIALALGACSARAVLTEDELYMRADALILARESFEYMRRACSKAGGVMSITRTATNINSRPSLSEYRLARCVRM